jgi:hypothetical protein
MPKVPPYHSVDQAVYHIFSQCTEGNNIEPDKLRSGTGGKRLCKNCIAILLGISKR